MPQLVTAIFISDAVAQEAVLSLRKYGFGSEDIVHLTPSAGLVPSLKAEGLTAAQASTAATEIGAGGAVVGARTPFGHGTKVVNLLQSHQPARVWIVSEAAATPGVGPKVAPSASDKVAAPLSTLLGLPLLSNDAFPLSRLLNWPTLAFFSFSRWLGFKELSVEPAPFSKTMSMPLLSNDAFPLSRILGLKLLSDNPAPLSSMLGMKTLL